MSERLHSILEKLVPWMLGLVATFAAWTVNEIYARPTKDEVKVSIAETSPYVKDREKILDSIARAEKATEQASITASMLRSDLNELQNNISTLLQITPADVFKNTEVIQKQNEEILKLLKEHE